MTSIPYVRHFQQTQVNQRPVQDSMFDGSTLVLFDVTPVTYAWFVVQITVAAASGRRHLLRKDFGMQPVKIIPATPNPVQPAFNTKSRRGKGTQARSEVTPWRGDSVARRQLASTCTSAISDTIYGDINFDCEFTFVQVTSRCLPPASWDIQDNSTCGLCSK